MLTTEETPESSAMEIDGIRNESGYKEYLILGEGNFSFAHAFLKKHIQEHPDLGCHIRATAYESEEELVAKYGQAFLDHVTYLREHGVIVLFNIDARIIDVHPDLSGLSGIRFDAIHFNFPYNAPDTDEQDSGYIKKMLGEFFRAAAQVQNENSKIYIGLPRVPDPPPINPHTGKPFKDNFSYKVLTYGIYDNSCEASYRLDKKRHHGHARYPEYGHVQTLRNQSATVADLFPREYIFRKTNLPPHIIRQLDDFRKHKPLPTRRGSLVPELSTEDDTSEVAKQHSHLAVRFEGSSKAHSAARKLMKEFPPLKKQIREEVCLDIYQLDEFILLFRSLEAFLYKNSSRAIYTFPEDSWKYHVCNWYYKALRESIEKPNIYEEDHDILYKIVHVARELIVKGDAHQELAQSILSSLFYLLMSHRERITEIAIFVLESSTYNWQTKVVAASILMRLQNDLVLAKGKIIPILIANLGYDPRMDWILCSFLKEFGPIIHLFMVDKKYHAYLLRLTDYRLIYKMLEHSKIDKLKTNSSQLPNAHFQRIVEYLSKLRHKKPLNQQDQIIRDAVYIRTVLPDQLSLSMMRNLYTGDFKIRHVALIADIFLPGISYRSNENGSEVTVTFLHNREPAQAYFDLGMIYKEGRAGCVRDFKEAESYFALAATNEFQPATVELLELFVNGYFDPFIENSKFWLNNFKNIRNSVSYANEIRSDASVFCGIHALYSNQIKEAQICFELALRINPNNQLAEFYKLICTALHTDKLSLDDFMRNLSSLSHELASIIYGILSQNLDLRAFSEQISTANHQSFLLSLLGYLFLNTDRKEHAMICFHAILDKYAAHEFACSVLNAIVDVERVAIKTTAIVDHYRLNVRFFVSPREYNAQKTQLLSQVSNRMGYLTRIAEPEQSMYLSAAHDEQHIVDPELVVLMTVLFQAIENDEPGLHFIADSILAKTREIYHPVAPDMDMAGMEEVSFSPGYNPSLFLPTSRNGTEDKKQSLLNLIGRDAVDALNLSDKVRITRGEVEFSIRDYDQYYSADLINLLLHRFNQTEEIKVYPAIILDKIAEIIEQVSQQRKRFAFIPLCVPYDSKGPNRNNHWVALIADKKHQIVLYLDPATKTDARLLPRFFDDPKPAILNPIDFQQAERDEGWVRHCGAYVIELFNCFAKFIEQGGCISESFLPDPSIPDSSAAVTVFSTIPCGEAEDISRLRDRHIEEAIKIAKSIPVAAASSAMSL